MEFSGRQIQDSSIQEAEDSLRDPVVRLLATLLLRLGQTHFQGTECVVITRPPDIHPVVCRPQ
jgi:hypothetical protein